MTYSWPPWLLMNLNPSQRLPCIGHFKRLKCIISAYLWCRFWGRLIGSQFGLQHKQNGQNHTYFFPWAVISLAWWWPKEVLNFGHSSQVIKVQSCIWNWHFNLLVPTLGKLEIIIPRCSKKRTKIWNHCWKRRKGNSCEGDWWARGAGESQLAAKRNCW